MKPARILTVLLLVVTASACSAPIQIHYPATPHFYGRIIDEETKQPIDGARVLLKEYPDQQATMAPGGYFDMAGVQQLFPQPVIFGTLDLPVPKGSLVVDADGYKPVETRRLSGEEVSNLTFELQRQ